MKTICLNNNDNVAVAIVDLKKNISLNNLVIKNFIPKGHKLALQNINLGDPIIKLNHIIGIASKNIKKGEHVHTHNINLGKIDKINIKNKIFKNERLDFSQKSFKGIKRNDGSIATRNYIGIITSVNCSSTVAKNIASYFSKNLNPQILKKYNNVDGIVALTHSSGCAISSSGQGIKMLRKTIGGYIRHPNFFGILFIGLGCETNNINSYINDNKINDKFFYSYNIQNCGGTQKAIQIGIDTIKKILPKANLIKRELCNIKNIKIGLQCGGSDGFSGLTSNPALGSAVDILINHGGSAILSETPEIFGAENLLIDRCKNKITAKNLINLIEWWKEYSKNNKTNVSNNPSFGNKEGGLSTIIEKSLGAVAKSGSKKIQAVYKYADNINMPGLVFMDSPGYDPISATGQIASGANLICFTTGRGSAFGSAPSPCIKLSSNTDLWMKQNEDIDINCGEILEGKKNINDLGMIIFNEILEVASGKKTKSEINGYGQEEFVPWVPEAIM
jgi:altronate hydrolase